MEEAEFIAWHIAEGDRVAEGQDIAEIATDKIDHDLPSPADGVVVELIANPGETYEVGAVIARIQP